jgi:hypothetical protein
MASDNRGNIRGATYERVRLGHALDVSRFEDDEVVREALAIACGLKLLAPRPPNDGVAVEAAERCLGADPRPIYAYVGDLHPGLGQVGLIFSCRWLLRCGQGISRCDSGGLAGRRGGFSVLEPTEVDVALRAVSFTNEQLPAWHVEFESELTTSYDSGLPDYVVGAVPRHETWADVRRRCIAAALLVDPASCPDRRLWTWEARMSEAPQCDEIECLVLSPEGVKRLEALRRDRVPIPDKLRILRPDPSPTGVHYFLYASVRLALQGEAQ